LYQNCFQHIGLPKWHAFPLKSILWLAHGVSLLQIVELSDCHTWKNEVAAANSGHINLLKETLLFCLIPILLCVGANLNSPLLPSFYTPLVLPSLMILSGSSLTLLILSGSFLTLLAGPYHYGLILLWFSSQAYLFEAKDFLCSPYLCAWFVLLSRKMAVLLSCCLRLKTSFVLLIFVAPIIFNLVYSTMLFRHYFSYLCKLLCIYIHIYIYEHVYSAAF